MRLLLDEHFSFRIAEQLRRRGFDVVAVVEHDELRETSDEDLVRWARGQARAVVTENVQDFLPVHARFLNQGEAHGGLVLTTSRNFPRSNAGIGPLVAALAALLERHRDEGSLASDILWL